MQDALPDAVRPRTRFLRQFVRYLGVGSAAAAIDLAAFFGLHGAGLGVMPSAAASFGVAAVFNFGLSARFVFETDASQRRFALFVACALAGLAINTTVTTAAAVGLSLPAVLAKIVGIGTAFLFNFTANAFVVFVGRPSH